MHKMAVGSRCRRCKSYGPFIRPHTHTTEWEWSPCTSGYKTCLQILQVGGFKHNWRLHPSSSPVILFGVTPSCKAISFVIICVASSRTNDSIAALGQQASMYNQRSIHPPLLLQSILDKARATCIGLQVAGSLFMPTVPGSTESIKGSSQTNLCKIRPLSACKCATQRHKLETS